jgi:hypothetical protein
MVARQRLGKHVAAAANTHETIELFGASFSMRSVLYKIKAGDYFFPDLLVLFKVTKLE